jgi:hypothetical protein
LPLRWLFPLPLPLRWLFPFPLRWLFPLLFPLLFPFPLPLAGLAVAVALAAGLGLWPVVFPVLPGLAAG